MAIVKPVGVLPPEAGAVPPLTRRAAPTATDPVATAAPDNGASTGVPPESDTLAETMGEISFGLPVAPPVAPELGEGGQGGQESQGRER